MRCDFHCHTFYSHDSTSSPEEMVERAIKVGLECLAITDHNEIEGAKRAKEYAKGRILIIVGSEIKTKEGDIIALNIKEKIQKGLCAKETIKKIKEQGGFVILPHPFAFWEGFKGKIEEILEEIDAIEIFNASIFGKGNKIAEIFAKTYNLPFVASSDAHFPSFLGRVFTEVEGKNLTEKEIFQRIKERRVKIFAKDISFFEKFFDHSKRNFAKILNYAHRKKRKV